MTVTVDTAGAEAAIAQKYRELVDDGFQAMLVEMEATAPRDKGDMVNDIEIEVADTLTTAANRMHVPAEYASWQDEGVEGPIYPTRSKVLHFIAKDGTEVFVRSTKGVPRTNWFSGVTARMLEFLQGAMS